MCRGNIVSRRKQEKKDEEGLRGVVQRAASSENASRELQALVSRNGVEELRELSAFLSGEIARHATRKHLHHVIVALLHYLDEASVGVLLQEVLASEDVTARICRNNFGCRVVVAALRRCDRGCCYAQRLRSLVLDLGVRLVKSSMGVYVVQQAVWELRAAPGELQSKAAALCNLVSACWRTSSRIGVLQALVEVKVPGAAVAVLETEAARLFEDRRCDNLARLLHGEGVLTAAQLGRPRMGEVLAEPVATFDARVEARRQPASQEREEDDYEPSCSRGCPCGEIHREERDEDEAQRRGACACDLVEPFVEALQGVQGDYWERVVPLSNRPTRAILVSRLQGQLSRILHRRGGVRVLEMLVRHAVVLEEELRPIWAELAESLPQLVRFAPGRYVLEALRLRRSSLASRAEELMQLRSRKLRKAAQEDEEWCHVGSALVPVFCVVSVAGAASTAAACQTDTHVLAACFFKGRSKELAGDEQCEWRQVQVSPEQGAEWCLFWIPPPRLCWSVEEKNLRHLRRGGFCVSSLPLTAAGCSFVVSLFRDEEGQDQGGLEDGAVRVLVAVRLLDMRRSIKLRLLGHEPVTHDFDERDVCILGNTKLWLQSQCEVVVAVQA